MRSLSKLSTLELNQELRNSSCFLNCGGCYCSREERIKCRSYLRANAIDQALKEREQAKEYKRNNPQPVYRTSRDYEKAILVQQEEQGFYDI
jgi:hypothetical protein